MTEVVDVRMFANQKHPRAPKGSQAGGEFAPAKQSSKGSAGKSTGATHAAAHHSDVLSYDGNTGTGYGSKDGDPRVHKLQEALNGLGITDAHGELLVDDGKLGPKTTEAVKAAQKRLGLPQDGKVTPALLHKLTEAKTSTKTKTKTPHRSDPAFLLDARADASKPYGDVSYADPGYQSDGKKRYPLDSEAHCRAAWSYINQADNAGRYTAEQLAAIKSRIKAAGRKYGIEFSTDEKKSAMTPDIDVVRALALPAEIRAAVAEEDGLGVLRGYFSTFDVWYPVESKFEGRFLERAHREAFTDTIARDRSTMKVLFDHGHDPTIGNKVLGPIRDLRPDESGGRFEVPLFDTTYNRDLLPGLRAAVYGASMRMHVIDDEWDNRPQPSAHNPDGLPERTITRAKVMEFGPVTFPANPSANAGVRSMTDRYYDQLRQRDTSAYESALRAASRVVIDLTGGSDARSADRGEPDTEPGNGAASPMHLRQRLDDGALRARGIK